MRLYFSPGAISRVTHIALVEAGASFELVLADTRAGAQRSPEYLAVNPKGRVPALETERGVLTETPAILAYVAQTFPEARLAPLGDPFAFAQVQALNDFLAAGVHVAFAHAMRPARYADDPPAQAAMKAKTPQALHEHFSLLEARMVGPWAHGEAYSISDPYLFVLGSWLEGELGDLGRYPKLYDHAKSVLHRPAVQKIIAVEQAWPRD